MSTQTPPTDNLFTLWDTVSRLEHDNVVIPSPYIQIENFLNPQDASWLLNEAVSRASLFESAQAKTGYLIAHQAMLLRRREFPEMVELMLDRVHTVLPTVLLKLNIAPFSITRTEMQLIATQDGGHFEPHCDRHPQDSRRSRKLSYVYYLHHEPKPFSGGELRLYDSKIEQGCYGAAESFKTIEPHHNSIVFFHSRNIHEVLPVSCPSQQFRDSRFAINGWIHQ